MTSCCPLSRTWWSGATGAIARCKKVSTGCGRKSRSVCALRWICGVKPTPKAGNKPLHHFIVHGLDKPGGSATVSIFALFAVGFGPLDNVKCDHRPSCLQLSGPQEPYCAWTLDVLKRARH